MEIKEVIIKIRSTQVEIDIGQIKTLNDTLLTFQIYKNLKINSNKFCKNLHNYSNQEYFKR